MRACTRRRDGLRGRFPDCDDDFVDFVSAHWSRLFRFAYLLTGAEANAEDPLQTSMEKTFARGSRVGRMEAPEAYVRKLVLNTLI